MTNLGVSVFVKAGLDLKPVIQFMNSFVKFNTYKPVEIHIAIEKPAVALPLITSYNSNVFVRLIPPSLMNQDASLYTLAKVARHDLLMILQEKAILNDNLLNNLVEIYNSDVKLDAIGITDHKKIIDRYKNIGIENSTVIICDKSSIPDKDTLTATIPASEILNHFTHAVDLSEQYTVEKGHELNSKSDKTNVVKNKKSLDFEESLNKQIINSANQVVNKNLIKSNIQKHICILSRKALRDITRVVRQARALSEAGHKVTVISLEKPVKSLMETTPDVEYYETKIIPWTSLHISNLRNIMRGVEGKEFVYPRLQHTIDTIFDEFERNELDILSSILLRKPNEKYSDTLENFQSHEEFELKSKYLNIMRSVAITNEFSDKAIELMQKEHIDYVQAHDNYALVAAYNLSRVKNAKLIYDAVELSEHRLATSFSIIEKMRECYEREIEEKIIREAWKVITVSHGLSDWYANKFDIDRPLVVRNCRYYWPYTPDTRVRTDINLKESDKLVIWSGSAYPQQGLELLVETAPLLPDNIHIAIVATILPRWKVFMQELQERISIIAANRVHILPPRAPNDLVSYCSGADIGVIPRPVELLNNYYSMPNKFLEMTQARLPIAVSALHDMSEAVKKSGHGAVFPENTPEVLAATIMDMLKPENYERLRENAFKAAERDCWELESKDYLELFNIEDEYIESNNI